MTELKHVGYKQADRGPASLPRVAPTHLVAALRTARAMGTGASTAAEVSQTAQEEIATLSKPVQEELEEKLQRKLEEKDKELQAKLAEKEKELRAMLEEQAKEKRKEELSRKAAKRMGNQGILRGWTAWQEMWEEAARQKRMLAAAGARLAKPKLAACFSLWTASWLETEKLKSTKGVGQMLLDKEKECDTLQAEVASLTEELAAVRYAALSEAEKEKHDRVERLAQKSLRRMINAGFLRGWGAWHEKWEEAARQKRMLAAASARLARPKLVACFSLWSESWHAEAAQAAKGTDQLLAEERVRCAKLEEVIEKLQQKSEGAVLEAS